MTRQFIRDNGDAVDVDYETSGGSSAVISLPWLSEPGEPPEITITDVWLSADGENPDAPRVTLTDAEVERFEREVCEDPATYEVDDLFD